MGKKYDYKKTNKTVLEKTDLESVSRMNSEAFLFENRTYQLNQIQSTITAQIDSIKVPVNMICCYSSIGPFETIIEI